MAFAVAFSKHSSYQEGEIRDVPPVAFPTPPSVDAPSAATSFYSSNFAGSQEQNHLPTARLPIVPDGGGYYSDGMEVVWHGEFSRLFSCFHPPHVWYLTITNQAPPQKWRSHRDSAKVRFCCQDCGNGWTSMKGRVTFWFHLDHYNHAGFVQFKLYGQQCKKCNSGKFEYVMWYPEEVSKVMNNVFNKVGQTYYGFFQPPIRVDRRPGRPRNQHNSSLCQACRDGECDQGRPKHAIEKTENFPADNLIREGVVDQTNQAKAKDTNIIRNSSKPTKQEKLNAVNLDVIPKSVGPRSNVIEHDEATVRKETISIEKKLETPKVPVYPVVNSNSNQLMPVTVPFSTVNSCLYYHPVPRHQLIPRCLPFNQSAVFPLFPTKSIIRPLLDPLPPPTNLAAVTELMASSRIEEENLKKNKNQISFGGSKRKESLFKSNEKIKKNIEIQIS